MQAQKDKRKITLRELRMRAAAAGFLTMGSLAARIGCSRPSIYFALERPSRYPRVYQKILEVIE